MVAFLLDPGFFAPAEMVRSVAPHAAVAIALLSAAVLGQVVPRWRREGHYPPRFVLFASLGGVAAVSVTIWLAVILADYVSSVRRAEAQVATAAGFLDEYMERSLDGAELLTRKVEETVRELGGVDALVAAKDEWLKLRAATDALPQVSAIVVADRDGMVAFNTQDFPTSRKISVADRTYFKLHRDAGIRLHIGSAIFAKSTGEAVFTYSRRLDGADGGMVGVALASIGAGYFDNVFGRLGIGEGVVAGFLRANGDVLAINDGLPAANRNFADLTAFHSAFQGESASVLRGQLEGGLTRIVAVHRNTQLGTLAFASVPVSTALSGWRTNVAATGGVLTAILGVLGTLGILGHRSIRREERLKALSESLAAFQDAVISSAATAIIATDKEGTITLFNAAAERLLGWRSTEMIGQRTPECFHDGGEVVQRSAELSAALGRRIDPGFQTFVARLAEVPVDEHEWTYIRKDGSKVPVLLSVSALRDSRDGITGYLGVALDVSARRKAEREMRHSETRLRAIVDNVIDSIITINAQGIIQSFNPAAERMFGYGAADVIGSNVSMLMDEPHRSQHDGYLDNYMATGHAKIIGIGREVEGLRRDGSSFPAELTVTEVDVSGRRIFVGVIRDLSERKKVERMKEEFVSTVSHELRTPLTAIRGSLSLVNSGVLGDVPDEIRELTEVAEQSSERLVLLINDILDVEKIGSGQLRLEIAPVGVDELLDKALADTKGYADKYGIGLRAEERTGGVRFRADSHRMIQVLANLISNAVKFSPPRGEVVVSTSLRPGGLVRFSVMDHGPGIPDEFRAHIFEKFAQADASDSKVKGGTGLGLAITKGLVERMGGEIGFDTQSGRGTTFHVDFPIIEEMPVAAIRDAHGTGLRVLHVEDDEATRLLLARLLGAQAEVIGAASVVEAIALAHSQSFDLTVIDLGLPDGNGLEVLSHVEDRNGHLAPAAIFSAFDDVPANLPPNVGAVLVKSRLSDRDLAQTLLSLMDRKEDAPA
jgi:PAS domain S-box-containing protein